MYTKFPYNGQVGCLIEHCMVISEPYQGKKNNAEKILNATKKSPGLHTA
jgi:hypothetical protein